MSFRLRDTRPDRTFFANVELVEQGTIQQFEAKVEEYSQTSDLSLIVIENKVYPVVKQKDSRIFYSKKRYTSGEAILLPLMVSYMIVSTWLNIQQYALAGGGGIVFELNIATTALLLMNFGMGVLWAMDRLQQQVHVVRLKKRYYVWESIVTDGEDIPVVTKEQVVHRGKRGIHVLLAYIAGIMTLGAVANLELAAVKPTLYFSWDVVIIVIILLILGNWKIRPELNPMGTRLMYAPALLERTDENEYHIVDAYENVLESPNQNFETVLTLSESQHRQIENTIISLEEVEKYQNQLLEDLEKDQSSIKFVDLIQDVKQHMKMIYRSLNYLIHQLKIKDSEILADKADLHLAEEIIESHALKATQFSEVQSPRSSFWATLNGRLIIGGIIILGAIYGYLWYNDQTLLSGVTP